MNFWQIEAGVTPDVLEQTFSDYMAHARALQAKYADRIALVVGCETENIHGARAHAYT